jgi:membrane carboxypeptidase/penicillin-binding protein
LASGAREKEWSQALEDFAIRGGLEPAVITSVEEKNAVAYARNTGRVNLGWTAISWARNPLPDGSVGPALQRASDVLAVGDVIYVAQEVSGNWRMVQIPDAQGAFVAVDPQDGAIAALSGGFDYFASNYNRAVQAKRQPGSSFKPFLYSAALDQGFTPASIVNDAPLVIEDATLEGSWRPQNNTREFRGPMRLREALVRSRNLVSIRVMNALGPAYATQFIERFGFPESSLPRNLSLALGTAQVSPLEMAGAYSVFANGGFRVEPYFVQRIVGSDGTVVYEAQPKFACTDCVQPTPETEGSATNLLEAPIRADASDETRWGGRTYLQDHRHDGRRRSSWNRGARHAVEAQRPGRQNRHHQRSARRLVLRLQQLARRHRVGRLRPGTFARARRRRQPHGAADVDLFHGRGAQGRAGTTPHAAARLGLDADFRGHRPGRAAGRSERDL